MRGAFRFSGIGLAAVLIASSAMAQPKPAPAPAPAPATAAEPDLAYGAFQRGYFLTCLLYTSPSPRDRTRSRMPSSA